MIGERNTCICIVRCPLNSANDTSPKGMIHYHMEKTQPMIKDGGKKITEWQNLPAEIEKGHSS